MAIQKEDIRPFSLAKVISLVEEAIDDRVRETLLTSGSIQLSNEDLRGVELTIADRQIITKELVARYRQANWPKCQFNCYYNPHFEVLFHLQ